MSESSQNEILLSAYLDGELAADELKKVQDLIATDAHARFLLQQWKDQRDALKSLPPATLRKDLSAGILNRLNLQAAVEKPTDVVKTESFKDGNDSSRQFNWRILYTIASSLAAILLVGLFLFSGRGLWQNDQLAAHKNLGEKSAQSMEVDSGKQKNTEPASPASSPSTFEIPSPGNDNPLSVENHVAERPPNHINPAKSDLTLSNAPTMSMSAETAEPKARSAPQPATANRGFGSPDDVSSPAQLMSSGSSPGEQAMARPFLDASVTTDQIVNVNQVFLIDIKDPNTAPLALLSEVFTRNKISILNGGWSAKDSPAVNSGEPSVQPEKQAGKSSEVKGEAFNELFDQPPAGMEAIFVVATRSQLRSAMQELIKDAEISGAEVLHDEKLKRKSEIVPPGQKPEPSMDDLIANKKKELESQPNPASKKLSPASRQAMAQVIQMRSMRNKERFVPGSAGGLAAGENAAGVRESKEQLIPLEELQWRFDELAVDGIKEETPNDSPVLEESQISEELVPFLLFVRNKPSK